MARSKNGQARRRHQMKLRYKRSYKRKRLAAKSQ